MKKFRHIALALCFVAVFAVSCGPRVIPRGKLAEIYAEMFLADQWLRENPPLNRSADTLLVYEPILEHYGYTTDDYLRSVERYMRDPDKYAKLLRGVSKRLDEEVAAVKKQISREQYLSGLHLDRVQVADSLLRRYRSYYLGRPRVAVDSLFQLTLLDYSPDTTYEGPRMIVWADTVALRDSLALADSLAMADSLAWADSLQLDSLAKTKEIVKEKKDSVEVFVGKRIRRVPRAERVDVPKQLEAAE